MGKLQKLCIEFESKDDVYHAGQAVIGAALIELSESMDVRGEWRAVALAYTPYTETYFWGSLRGVEWSKIPRSDAPNNRSNLISPETYASF